MGRRRKAERKKFKKDGIYAAEGRQFNEFAIWVEDGAVLLAGGPFHWAAGHKWKRFRKFLYEEQFTIRRLGPLIKPPF